jgi:hypothetical protein
MITNQYDELDKYLRINIKNRYKNVETSDLNPSVMCTSKSEKFISKTSLAFFSKHGF